MFNLTEQDLSAEMTFKKYSMQQQSSMYSKYATH